MPLPPGPNLRAVLAIDGQAVARLAFTNLSQQRVFLDRHQAAVGGVLENSIFEIVRKGGAVALPYAGVIAKRPAPGIDDFVAVEPGATLNTTIPLREFYRLPPTREDYVGRYSAYHGFPDKVGIWHLLSNDATFTLEGSDGSGR
jgi:hypothetical protein